MIMPFGKHRGKLLEDIPLDYLQWVIDDCENIKPQLRTAIERVLRGDESQAGSLAIPTIAARWYRTLAGEFHPDKGGNHQAMVAVNRARDLLLEMAGVAQ